MESVSLRAPNLASNASRPHVRESHDPVVADALDPADMEGFFESFPGLFLILKRDFTIIAASEAYLLGTMTTRDAIIGRGIFEVFPDNPEDASCDGVSNLRASLDEVLATAESHTMAIQRYDIRREDGEFEERYWSPINSPIRGRDGEVRFLIHRVEDVTEFVIQKRDGGPGEIRAKMQRMEAEIFNSSQTVQKMNLQLEAANKELESFSYSVSHDLRAPLRAIDGFSKALTEDFGTGLPEEAQRYLKVIRDGAQRMGRLIDDLLAFSRLGRASLSSADANVAEIARRALETVQKEYPNRHVELSLGDLPAARGDAALLEQVWLNLLSNAYKFTGKTAKPAVEIGSLPSPSGAIYFVRDNGAGFDMRYSAKVFEVFQRLHRAEDFEGTGVGLATTRRIVERHGGEIWAESKVGDGSTFYFTLKKHER